MKPKEGIISQIGLVTCSLISRDTQIAYNISNLSQPVQLHIPFNLSSMTNEKLSKLKCGYYNCTLRAWSYDGCSTQIDVEKRLFVCVCNHLTDFSFVLDEIEDIYKDSNIPTVTANPTHFAETKFWEGAVFIIKSIEIVLAIVTLLILNLVQKPSSLAEVLTLSAQVTIVNKKEKTPTKKEGQSQENSLKKVLKQAWKFKPEYISMFIDEDESYSRKLRFLTFFVQRFTSDGLSILFFRGDDGYNMTPVSYTHLTLPTIYSV
eukprot:TRINITY_DN5488_c0_g1_i1.p1 TRINITY_DN5488_c0_g1~~TRINITY_DN5488_c0_g1_i1.p1  ORF type:complete len:262 (-),score=35.75 TRINITY_DN5488_c0_g1_i1:34-819(-)